MNLISPVLSSSPLMIYTDGSSLGNPGPAGWAWWRNDGEKDSGPLAHATNQQAELYAVLMALTEVPPGSSITLVTDSTFVEGCITGHFRVKNPNVRPVKNMIDDYIIGLHLRISVVVVKGHSNDKINNLVDQMAKYEAVVESSRQNKAGGS